jgi:hypothetical protein
MADCVSCSLPAVSLWLLKWSEEVREYQVCTGRKLGKCEVKWSEVKWSEVKWSEVKWSEVKWKDFEVRRKSSIFKNRGSKVTSEGNKWDED